MVPGVTSGIVSEKSLKLFEKMKYLYLFFAMMFLGLLGYSLTRHSLSEEPSKESPATKTATLPKAYPHDDHVTKTRSKDRGPEFGKDAAALAANAIPNQRTIIFTDRAAMYRFLARSGGGVSVLGKLDGLNALRVGFGDEADLLALLDGSEENSLIYPVNIPDLTPVGSDRNATSVENGMLSWLGVTGDNSGWGAGVKVAILDTGIADHLVFKNPIERINLVPLPEDASTQNPHGTAVASVIFSDNPFAPGIAPSATPLSVRIADDSGSSDSFLIAQGIIAAVDAGADLINISLGGHGKSNLVTSALEYADQAGSVVIASSGNSGTEGILEPAASPSVIAVGAVDARNGHLNFSTTGPELAVSAAGFEVNVAYPGDQAARVSGTSFSAPAITGTLAATMSNSGQRAMNGIAAMETMNRNLNDIGDLGIDSLTGAGVPDMWRILNNGQRGIYDAAVTSVATDGNQVNVLVQNLGTETIVNAGVTVDVGGVSTEANLTTLAPGESRRVTVTAGETDGLNIRSSVRLSGGQTDQRPSNDIFSQETPATGP